jgi:predicted alpha/beta superfamily hydrolase
MFCLASALQAQQHKGTSDVSIGQRYSFYSETLQENQSYLLNLPRSYDKKPNAKYPLIVMLDGHRDTFHMGSGIARKLARSNHENNKVPEAIFVALPSKNRFRDYTPTKLDKRFFQNPPDWIDATGHGEAFRTMLRDELLPALKKDFRISDETVFVGHSLGGLIVLYDLISPDRLFTSYIALDASFWYDNRLLEQKARRVRIDRNAKPINLYIALAGSPDPTHQTAGKNFERIVTPKSKLIRSKVGIFDDERHLSVELIGLQEGLKHVFETYKPEDTQSE